MNPIPPPNKDLSSADGIQEKTGTPLQPVPQPDKDLYSAEAIHEAYSKYRPNALAIQETSASVVLATCMSGSFGKFISSCGFKAYRDSVLQASGQPSDPLEIMMIEQLLICHHRVGDLHVNASQATTAEEAAIYNAAAVRLMGEFRRTTLALREYRTPVVPRQVTVVKQQNLAAGDQQIAYLDGKTTTQAESTRNCDSELGSNRQEAIAHEQPTNFRAQSKTSSSWAPEPVSARAIDAGGP